MTTEEVLDLFRDSGALREGHFLSSGLRSPKARVFMYPEKAEEPGYEAVRHMGLRGVQ